MEELEFVTSEGAIDAKYGQSGGGGSPLGTPVSDEMPFPDRKGAYRNYQHGSIYWSKDTGAHILLSPISDKWLDLMKHSSFNLPGYPTMDEVFTPDGVGRAVHCQTASIYWHPSTGAWEVHGLIRDKWASLGWQEGFLGYPISDEIKVNNAGARCSHFQHGSIYFHPDTGAHEMHGAIRDKWMEIVSRETVPRTQNPYWLGLPTTDETPTPDGVGRYNHFEFGAVYWHPQVGAHEVHGAILRLWIEMGWERSSLGYPTTDEMAAPGPARFNRFQKGAIFYSPDSGAIPVVGAGEYYVISIDKFHIENTRSTLTDTDYVSLVTKVGNQFFYPPTPVRFMGDVQGGDHDVGLYCGPFRIDDTGISVLFNFQIMNSGSGAAEAVADSLKKAGEVVADSGVLGPFSIVAEAFGWIAGLFSGCDGICVQDQIGATGAQLTGWTTGHRVFTRTKFYSGTYAGVMCGLPSRYHVTYSVIRL